MDSHARKNGFWTLVAGGCLLTAVSAWAQQPSVLQTAQDEVKALQAANARLTQDTGVLCQQAEESDHRLAQADAPAPAALRELSSVATRDRNICEAGQQQVESLSRALAQSKQRLRTLARDIGACDGNVSCLAQLRPDAIQRQAKATQATLNRAASLQVQRAAPAVGEVGAPIAPYQAAPPQLPRAATAAADADQPSLLARAASAAASAATLRSELAGFHPLADKSAAGALSFGDRHHVDKGLAGNENTDKARELAGLARQSLDDAAAAPRGMTRVQRAANDMVRSALDRLQCESASECQAAEQAALAAEANLRVQQADTRKRFDQAKLAAFDIEAAQRFNTDPEREQAARLARTLDAYPNLGILSAPDAVRLSTSTAGSQASIKYAIDRLLSNGNGRTTLALSAPLGDSDRTSVFRTADGLASMSRLKLDHTLAKGFGKEGEFFGGFRAFGLAAELSYEKRRFYELSDLDGVADLEELARRLRTRSVKPWSLSLYGALGRLNPDWPSMHLFKLSLQRAYNSPDDTVTCPVSIAGASGRFNCVNAAIGAPTRDRPELVYSYELRRTFWNVAAASIIVSYNRKDRVKDVSIPIYLLRSSDDDKLPLSGGIQLDWSSKSGSKFGVFVGAPFSLFATP